MNKERYYANCALYLCDNDLNNTLSIFECADLLNQLTEENEQLKQKIDFYKYFQKDARELEKENEQLRKELDNFKPVIFQDMRKGTVILYSKGD